MSQDEIPALLPRTSGYQFVLYGDACSGVPGARHETTFASVNAVIRRLQPQPEFILFPGDEIIGLTDDADALRAQWRHWLDHEMSWLDRPAIPLWHTTGNHTAYDTMSEDVFREVLDLPKNGPPGQEGLSYWVRRGDLLLVFVHTLWTGLGGEGHVETEWLESVLRQHADARHKLVLGHHPVYPVNGFSGPYQREIGPEHAGRFWGILVEPDVLAYVCSHILAFDVQVYRGVLQICTAGAGTAHRMPEGVEYLHCVQAALDDHGFRYQVLDTDGIARERLEWPMASFPAERWRDLTRGEGPASVTGRLQSGSRVEFRFRGRTAADAVSSAQTLLSAYSPGSIAPVWIGLQGPRQTLTLILGREPSRSPHYWIGPSFPGGENFDLHLAINPDMGPGGVLFRPWGERRWTSFAAASATGLETLQWPARWSVGHGQHGGADRPFAGSDLTVSVSIG
ncbi:metallophosphoesterase family protein [Microvirga subterranea]|uniref:Calcineurin-like phosphoesterase family protein n=1 Tax=Microvirga subterranea TaxID=186651 RepID=A0A370H697_9HYPH|nr:metallophosphoesterase [Microvirga subterranea]RDI51475.1 calcineurin-like phosphoesterase family protein [Microvirga subterranea]